jgi:hypothetical protein
MISAGAQLATCCLRITAFPKLLGYVRHIPVWRCVDEAYEQDIEICVPSEKLIQAQETFNAATEFCTPFRPGRSNYNQHLSKYPRFKIKGMNRCFCVVPGSHFGLSPKAFDDIMDFPHLSFPLLPLPNYVKGLANIATTEGTDSNNFVSQIEFLVDGMDIDEEWCHNYLDGRALAFVLRKSTRSAKKARMGSHPKYEGNLTTFIHDESERQDIIRVIGRGMDRQSEL